jgi:hypothetical protein
MSSRIPARRRTWRSISRLEPGRYGAGARSGPRRAPDARHEAEHFGKAVQLHQLRRDPRHAPHRLRSGGPLGPRAQAETDCGRRQRLSPRDPHERFAEIAAKWAQSCSSTWPTTPVWSPPDCTTIRCRWRISSPRPRTRRCAARGPAWFCAGRNMPKDLNRSVFPGLQGGPLMHVIAGQGSLFWRSIAAGIQESTAQAIIDNARRWPRCWRPADCG